MMKNIIVSVFLLLFGIFIGILIGNKSSEGDIIKVPEYIFIKDSLKIDSLNLEIETLKNLNNFLKDSIKINDSIRIVEKEKIKRLPLTEKVLFLKESIEKYERENN